MDSLQTLPDTLRVLSVEPFRVSYDSLAQALSALPKDESWLDPSNIIALASSLMALFSLVAAVAAVHIARAQGRASTRPFLMFGKVMKDQEGGMGLYVQNKGVGPAIIKSFEVFTPGAQPRQDSVESGPQENSELWPVQLKSNFQGNFEYQTLEEDLPLAPGETVWLFRFPHGHTNPTMDRKTRFLDSLRVRIEYLGIQGQRDIVRLEPAPHISVRTWRKLQGP